MSKNGLFFKSASSMLPGMIVKKYKKRAQDKHLIPRCSSHFGSDRTPKWKGEAICSEKENGASSNVTRSLQFQACDLLVESCTDLRKLPDFCNMCQRANWDRTWTREIGLNFQMKLAPQTFSDSPMGLQVRHASRLKTSINAVKLPGCTNLQNLQIGADCCAR